MGFSDHAIEALTKVATRTVRELRIREGIERQIAQIDTLAAEFPAETNYLYTTFHASQSDVAPRGVRRSWCSARVRTESVQASSSTGAASMPRRRQQRSGYETIMLNYNPETVSTDYDVCDRSDLRRGEPGSRSRPLRAGAARGCGREHGWPDSKQPRDPVASRWGEGARDQLPRTSIGPRTVASSVPCSMSLASINHAGSTSRTSRMSIPSVDRLGGFPSARSSELRAERRSDECGA